jgi:hypothetical protein
MAISSVASATLIKLALPISILIAGTLVYMAITLPYRSCVNSSMEKYGHSRVDAEYYCSQTP